MRPLTLERAETLEEAQSEAVRRHAVPGEVRAPLQYLAGGTVLLDLMKLDVMRPEVLVDINGLAKGYGQIEAGADGLRLGALARMAAVADHPTVRRDYPVIAEALWQAASPQLRNMASLAGNVLQKTRCPYFRDTSWHACNKRNPGSGCAALEGVNRRHAILGVSEHCIAQYPGDFANALVALEAQITVQQADGTQRQMPFEALHRLPGGTPQTETDLQEGDLITGFHVPAGPWTRRSRYVKVRDRASYDFALASAAVALDLDGDVVRTARVGLGGVATKPWRAHEAEAVLSGRRLDRAAAEEAARAAFAGAVTHGENAFKLELGQRTLVRALLETAGMEVSNA